MTDPTEAAPPEKKAGALMPLARLRSSSEQEMVETLSTMADRAGGQIEMLRQAIEEGSHHGRSSPSTMASSARELADLELFVELGQQQQQQYDGTSTAVEEETTLGPLHNLAQVVSTLVESELQQVTERLGAFAPTGDESADGEAKAGMEKRIGILNKERNVLGDVQTRHELARVLHGVSQVLQGVVLRAGRRLTAKDRQKERSIREKEVRRLGPGCSPRHTHTRPDHPSPSIASNEPAPPPPPVFVLSARSPHPSAGAPRADARGTGADAPRARDREPAAEEREGDAGRRERHAALVRRGI